MADRDRAPQAGTMTGSDEGDRAAPLPSAKAGRIQHGCRLGCARLVDRSTIPDAGPAVTVDLPSALGAEARELFEKAFNG